MFYYYRATIIIADTGGRIETSCKKGSLLIIS